MSSPMKYVLDVLASVAEIEWARCVGGEEPWPPEPPFIAWRFKEANPETEAKIVDAVKSFSGSIEWEIRQGRRNWIIEPALFAEYASTFRVDVDALRSYGTKFPSETRHALADASRLADYLRSRLL
jgi:hypothetical protein